MQQQNFSPPLLSVQCIKPLPIVSLCLEKKIPQINYSKFLNVYGKNIDRNYSLIALQFKRPEIPILPTYKYFNNPIEIPDGSIILLPGCYPDIPNDPSKERLFFRLHCERNDGSICVPRANTKTLLASFFKENSIKCQEFDKGTLFVLSTHNPFRNNWIEMRRNKAFHALKKYAYIYLGNIPLFSLNDVFDLRVFKTLEVSTIPSSFYFWKQFAYRLIYKKFLVFFPRRHPSTAFGKYVYECFARSLQSPDPRNPTHLYMCEISLDLDCFVGITFIMGKDNLVHYVSPMIVSFQTNEYRDTNRILCRLTMDPTFDPEICQHWLPLYRNKQTWQEFGFLWYLRNQSVCKLGSVLKWLYFTKVEKYRQIYNDISLIYHVLSEERLKWPLIHWYDQLSIQDTADEPDKLAT